MRGTKEPWLNENGTPKSKHELKAICRFWSAETWEEYLSSLETPLKEELVEQGQLEEIPESESYGEVYKALLQRREYPELEKKILQNMKALTLIQRRVIELLFWDRLSIGKTAEVLKVTRSTVVSYRDRAVKKLHNVMIP